MCVRVEFENREERGEPKRVDAKDREAASLGKLHRTGEGYRQSEVNVLKQGLIMMLAFFLALKN
jgi:hypothetical protein